uniref:Uncharacterized protein n=1 Tax=Solanum lycopersicum TaxID=4081 RepID=A0A3Q7EXI7_SOLLC
MPNSFWDIRQDLVYASGWPSQPVRPILKVKRAPKRAYPFRRQKCQKILCTSVKNFFYASFVPHGPSDPFLKIPTSKMPNFFWDIRQDLVYASSWPSRPVRPILKQTIFWVSRILTSKMQQKIWDIRQDLVYASCWPSRPVRPILKVKRASKRAYPSFR